MISFSDGSRDGVTTGADGAFKFIGLEAGTYELSAHVGDDEMFDFSERMARTSPRTTRPSPRSTVAAPRPRPAS